MTSLFSYKGYEGSAEVSIEDGVLYGKILFIRDLITYQAETPAALQAEFRAAVDDYLEDCRLEGVDPNRPYTGNFNVRIGSERHKELVRIQAQTGESLNKIICKAIDGFVRHDGKPRAVTNFNFTFRDELNIGKQESAWQTADCDDGSSPRLQVVK